MTEEHPAHTPVPEQPAPVKPVPAKPTPVKPVKAKTGVSHVAVLALIISSGALGASGYLWWQNQQVAAAQHTREADLQDRLFTVSHQLDQARAELGQYASV